MKKTLVVLKIDSFYVSDFFRTLVRRVGNSKSELALFLSFFSIVTQQHVGTLIHFCLQAVGTLRLLVKVQLVIVKTFSKPFLLFQKNCSDCIGTQRTVHNLPGIVKNSIHDFVKSNLSPYLCKNVTFELRSDVSFLIFSICIMSY